MGPTDPPPLDPAKLNPEPEPTEFEKFRRLAKRLITVPKKEIEKQTKKTKER
jgi:hypothetical protein